METGGSGGLGGAGYKRGGWIPRMRTMWITGSRTRVLEPGVRAPPAPNKCQIYS